MRPILLLIVASAFALSACDFVEKVNNPPPAPSSKAAYWNSL